MIEKFLLVAFIYLFLVLTLLVLVPFTTNITDDGIDGIKETFDMFKDKDFYLNVVIPVIINFSIIFLFCNLIAFVIILVADKINL